MKKFIVTGACIMLPGGTRKVFRGAEITEEDLMTEEIMERFLRNKVIKPINCAADIKKAKDIEEEERKLAEEDAAKKEKEAEEQAFHDLIDSSEISGILEGELVKYIDDSDSWYFADSYAQVSKKASRKVKSNNKDA